MLNKSAAVSVYRDVSSEEELRERNRLYESRVKQMFEHAYDNYMEKAFPGDELKPITGKTANSLQELGANGPEDRENFNKEYDGLAMSAIESMSTLAVIGNYTEFTRIADWLARNFLDRLRKNEDMRVNVFEANIRVLGGLLSAHALAGGNKIIRGDALDICVGNVGEEGMYKDGENEQYDGSLLKLAHEFGKMLLKSFNDFDDNEHANVINIRKGGGSIVKNTKLPYGWVNLKHGPIREKPETNVAAIGTLALEFGTLSRLTGDDRFEIKAKEAFVDLWSRRNLQTNLLGSVINVETGKWVNTVGGIGANGDSFHEYALKSYLMFGDEDYLDIFVSSYKAVMKYYHKPAGWFIDAEMSTGDDRHYSLSALQKFWPGLQALIGDIDKSRLSHTLMMNVWVKYGMSPERYMFLEDVLHSTQRGYELRPELSESTSILYLVTKDKRFLRDGRIIVEDLITYSKVKGGFATIEDALTKKRKDHMPSYFLSETLKYLYLLFTDFQFLNGKEVLFTTEGHILPAYRECPYVQNDNNNVNIVEQRTREVSIRLGFISVDDDADAAAAAEDDDYDNVQYDDDDEEKSSSTTPTTTSIEYDRKLLKETLAQIAEAKEARRIVQTRELNERHREEETKLMQDAFEWADSGEEGEEKEEEEDATKLDIEFKEPQTPEEFEKNRKIREAVMKHIEEQQREVRNRREREQRQLQELQARRIRDSLETPISTQYLNRADVRDRFKKVKGTQSHCHVLDERVDHSCSMIIDCGVNAMTCAQRVCASGACV